MCIVRSEPPRGERRLDLEVCDAIRRPFGTQSPSARPAVGAADADRFDSTLLESTRTPRVWSRSHSRPASDSLIACVACAA